MNVSGNLSGAVPYIRQAAGLRHPFIVDCLHNQTASRLRWHILAHHAVKSKQP